MSLLSDVADQLFPSVSSYYWIFIITNLSVNLVFLCFYTKPVQSWHMQIWNELYRFKDIFQEVYEEQWKDKFEENSIWFVLIYPDFDYDSFSQRTNNLYMSYAGMSTGWLMTWWPMLWKVMAGMFGLAKTMTETYRAIFLPKVCSSSLPVIANLNAKQFLCPPIWTVVLSSRSTSDGDKRQLTIQLFSKKFHPGETLTGSCAACVWPSVSVSLGLRPALLWPPLQATSPPPLAACSSPSRSLLTLVGATQVPVPPRCRTSAAANPSPAVQARGDTLAAIVVGAAGVYEPHRRSCDVRRVLIYSSSKAK